MAAFAVLAVFGVVLLLVSLLAGDMLDGLLEGIDLDATGGLFSTAVIGAFLAAVGIGGLAGLSILDLPPAGATATGIGAGLLVGGATFALTRALVDMPTDPTPRTADLPGATGTVVTPIPANGYGEVTVVRGGYRLKLNARADRPIPRGTQIVVVEAASPTAVVVTATDLAP